MTEGNSEEARAAHEESLTHFTQMGMLLEAAIGQFVLARAILQRRDAALRPWGRGLLESARETFGRIGFSRYVQEIDRMLAAVQA